MDIEQPEKEIREATKVPTSDREEDDRGEDVEEDMQSVREAAEAMKTAKPERSDKDLKQIFKFL